MSTRAFLTAVAGVIALEGVFSFWPGQLRALALLRFLEAVWMLACLVRYRMIAALELPDWMAIRVFVMAAVLSGVTGSILLLTFHLLDQVSAPAFIHGWIGIVLFILLAPLAEEVFFRGLLYGFMRQSFGIYTSAGFSAACFALAHGGLFLPQLAGGIIFAVAFEYSRNLWVPVLLHAGANTAVLLIGGMSYPV